MNLPPLTLPKVPIPFDIPQMLHPMVVHFAIALPVVVLFIEIINLVVKKRAIGVVSFLLLLIGSATIAISYLTGNVDASLVNNLTIPLKEHKTLGAYLVVLSAFVLGLKFISSLWRSGIIKALYMILLIVLTAGVCKAGFEGMSLVYTHGINIQKTKTLQNMLDVKDNQTKKLDSDYKLLTTEHEKLKIQLKDLSTQNKELKKSLENVQKSSPNIVEDIDENITIVPEINQTDIIKDENIT